MATREDQPESIVLDALLVGPRRCVDDGDLRAVADIVKRIEARAAAQTVDRFESSSRDEPCARVGGDAIPRPLLERSFEGIVQSLLGDVEVTEQTNECRQNASRVLDIGRVHRLVDGIDRCHNNRSHHSSIIQCKRPADGEKQVGVRQ